MVGQISMLLIVALAAWAGHYGMLLCGYSAIPVGMP